jgi:RNA polymerase sigma factor (sigma-70 family)
VIAVVERTELAGGLEDAYSTCFLVAYQAAYRIIGDRNDAEDIAQESMVRAYTRWARIGDYAEAWVARVATNLALDSLRRRRRVLRPSTRDLELAAVDDRLDLARAIARLPRRQRDAVALRYIADLAEIDVARVMGCSVGAVKQHASRGLASLRANGHLAVEES